MKKDMTDIDDFKDKDKKIIYKPRVSYRDENGKRKQISKNFRESDYGNADIAYSKALEWRDTKRTEVRQGKINLMNANFSIDDIFEKTLTSLSQSKETKRKWRIWYKKYVLRFIDGNFLFSKITWDNHIKPSLDAMVNDCSQDLINRVKSIWRKMCFYAFTRNLVSTNQILLAETSGRILSKAAICPRNKKINMEELLKLLEVFDDHKENERLAFIEKSALKLMAYLGFRPAEVFVLETGDIDLKNRTIHIYKRLGSSTDEKYIATSLGNKGYKRLVPYPSSLDSLINELIEKSENGKLFTVGGIYLNSNTLSSDVHRISGGKINAYMLRHAFSNSLIVNKKKADNDGEIDETKHILSSNEQQVATQDILGHVDIDMTRKYQTDKSRDEMEIASKQEKEDKFNEQVKAVNLRAKELDELGLCDLKGDHKPKTEKKK